MEGTQRMDKGHLAVDVRIKKILGIEITDEKVSDSKMFSGLIEQAEKKGKIEKVLADGTYDTRESFNLREEKGTESGTKTRKNANPRGRGSPYRKKCVRELK